jgi:Leucine-rich repeat (LRR) protein
LENHPELIKEEELILKKCSGLPLAIVTIGGFLANRPKTAMEWRKLNEDISAELEINPELEAIRTILGKSYDGLPYHLKSCFLYLSIFPEDHKVSRRRLMRRWAAEGYSREIRGKSAEQIADGYFMELIARSMILPSQESIRSRKRIDSCQLHDLMREISISKSMEENLVFRLEEGCSSNTQGMIRHLAVSGNWNGDRIEFENIANPCNIRSLTVFGKFMPFFISEKMRMLRVLDLEGTMGLLDHHLEHIRKLLHLRYLSLRGCDSIFYLPHSLGNLRQLETLDIKDTRIVKLPKAINRLRKLQYLRAGGAFYGESYEEFVEDKALPKQVKNKICMLTLSSALFCVTCCAPKILDEDMNRCDVCTAFCCACFPFVARRLDGRGVVMSSGLNKLTALHTLGTVNIGRGKDLLQDIKRLTRLRKLGVVGVNKENGKEFCSTLSTLSNLESLSVRSLEEPGLEGLLVFDGLLPPENLRSLKLEGNLVELPGWVDGLHNLVKLSLKRSMIAEQDTAMQILGSLPNLALLRLQESSFQGDQLHFTLAAGAFPSLVVLELSRVGGYMEDFSVHFEATATPKLELLSVSGFVEDFSGLSTLQSLKEVLLEGGIKGNVVQAVQDQLEGNPNKPILKSVD